MIPLDHWIPDELHIMLRITDRLWSLVLHEIKESAIRNPITDPKTFKRNAKMWLKLFLTLSTGTPNNDNFVQGLYRPNDLTPYIHILVFHIHELMEKHKKWGLKAFSCGAVEKKNHQQVSEFFRKTLRDGENDVDQKSAIF
ncbi:hypothetical protein C1645_839640 [Glomus cerebriforme]|uniref:Uncharacterized protein n=1 Tax=Glomus cerebriforme TaxID=658196 RepID=A0A397S5A1_9GLOM|nr:hypothetical protein C1645_839640 [Glomus cerebriforme]